MLFGIRLLHNVYVVSSVYAFDLVNMTSIHFGTAPFSLLSGSFIMSTYKKKDQWECWGLFSHPVSVCLDAHLHLQYNMHPTRNLGACMCRAASRLARESQANIEQAKPSSRLEGTACLLL